MGNAISQDEGFLAAIRGIGARLKQARRLRGWTQVELAARAGLSQNTISLIEGDARGGDLAVETLWRLAWALGTSMDMLAGMPDLRG
jgi:transcriptional regulator with XRE-family HTH domain